MYSKILILSIITAIALKVTNQTFMPPDSSCWGYEADCDPGNRVSQPHCSHIAKGWPGEPNPLALFYKQADFGFVKDQLKEMISLCTPTEDSHTDTYKSSLQCSKDLQFCIARNIFLDFSSITDRVKSENLKYRMDIFQPGAISLSDCDLDKNVLQQNLELMSPLQSWAPELQYLEINASIINDNKDVIIIEAPTTIMKLDATVNMYHHFCDFFNLYLSIHMNYSLSGMNEASWIPDKQIIILENIPYNSAFAPTWKAFTDKPLLDLSTLAGKKLLVKDAMFPLLPRMLFGLFYNTPVVEECYNSGMFRYFSKFILHHLNVKNHGVLPGGKMSVTMISRNARTRRLLNEQELVAALEKTGLYQVTVAQYSPKVPFTSQLQITHNTDILIGLHGAGLTHLLFLPDWAEVFELYNCGDPNCYKDLARLRGVGYTTRSWSDEAMGKVEVGQGYNGPAHEKFVNYKFDSEEFVQATALIRSKVMENPFYIEQLSYQHEEL